MHPNLDAVRPSARPAVLPSASLPVLVGRDFHPLALATRKALLLGERPGQVPLALSDAFDLERDRVQVLVQASQPVDDLLWYRRGSPAAAPDAAGECDRERQQDAEHEHYGDGDDFLGNPNGLRR